MSNREYELRIITRCWQIFYAKKTLLPYWDYLICSRPSLPLRYEIIEPECLFKNENVSNKIVFFSIDVVTKLSMKVSLTTMTDFDICVTKLGSGDVKCSNSWKYNFCLSFKSKLRSRFATYSLLYSWSLFLQLRKNLLNILTEFYLSISALLLESLIDIRKDCKLTYVKHSRHDDM
jgi:hypothetical protein